MELYKYFYCFNLFAMFKNTLWFTNTKAFDLIGNSDCDTFSVVASIIN